MGTFKTQKMAQIRATSCSAVFQVFKRRSKECLVILQQLLLETPQA
jgi:hypothetical protein